MKQHLLRVLALAVFAALPAVASAQRTAPPIKYETFTLSNGLTFVVHEDHSTPVVAVYVQYDVGSANEVAKRSGFAHLFEHMLFQETDNLGKGDIMKHLEAVGANWNGFTQQDRTVYYEVVPSNRVNLALWLEAERMGRLQVTEVNFQREREVVKEERRSSYDNAPYMSGYITMDTLQTDYAPYRHPVIGTMDDLNAATAADVLTFYKQYYVPRNATVVLAGDLTLAQAKELANQYFARIPGGTPAAKLPTPAPTPRTDGERRAVVEDKLASVPRIFAAYTTPEHAHDDTYALSLLASIVGGGESSRLNQRLVKNEKAAAQVGAGLNSRARGGYVFLQALPVQGVDFTKLEQLLWEELDKVRASGVTEQELDRAKRQLIAGSIISRQTVQGKADALQHARFMHGDLESVNSDLDKYNAVTVQDIKRVADKYLTPANRTVVTVVPAKKPAT